VKSKIQLNGGEKLKKKDGEKWRFGKWRAEISQKFRNSNSPDDCSRRCAHEQRALRPPNISFRALFHGNDRQRQMPSLDMLWFKKVTPCCLMEGQKVPKSGLLKTTNPGKDHFLHW
jgi:hypothetical protein